MYIHEKTLNLITTLIPTHLVTESHWRIWIYRI